MLISVIKFIDEGSDTGLCQKLNLLRNIVFKWKLVRGDGNIECLEIICGEREIFNAYKKGTINIARTASIT